jgi:hypothetical protein
LEDSMRGLFVVALLMLSVAGPAFAQGRNEPPQGDPKGYDYDPSLDPDVPDNEPGASGYENGWIGTGPKPGTIYSDGTVEPMPDGSPFPGTENDGGGRSGDAGGSRSNGGGHDR